MHKNLIIEFMQVKASMLPDQVKSLYFTNSDISGIADNWSELDARNTGMKMLSYIDLGTKLPSTDKDNPIKDKNLCPFCVKTNDKCNLCEYFTTHGSCISMNSDYNKFLWLIYGVEDNKKGIIDYIIETHGNEALSVLRDILVKMHELPIPLPPEFPPLKIA